MRTGKGTIMLNALSGQFVCSLVRCSAAMMMNQCVRICMVASNMRRALFLMCPVLSSHRLKAEPCTVPM